MLTDRYRKVYEKGKPKHDPYDDFSIKHPPMNLTRRAKIFSPSSNPADLIQFALEGHLPLLVMDD